MPRNQKDFTFDYDLRLKDAGLIAADDVAQVGGVDRVLDLGQGRFDGRVIVDVTALEIASNDERYILQTQFSDVADFSTGSPAIQNGTALQLGATEIVDGDDSPVGRHELPFTNEIDGTVYRYMRLWVQVEGTIATGINFVANVVTP